MYIIHAKNISKKFITGDQKNVIFHDLSLNVHEGEVVFISGHYGSGRTTLLKMIAAMTPPNHGTIEVLGRDLLTIEKRSDWRLKHIGFLTNEDCLVPYLTVKQHLLMGQDETDADFEFFNEEAVYILNMLGICDQKLEEFPDKLNQIDRLKITVARVLMSNPRLILLDEFTEGISDDERFDLISALVEYAKKQNITLILTGESEHCQFSDRFLKLENGRLKEINVSTHYYYH